MIDTATWTEQDSIRLSAELVARDGHRIALRGAERKAAIELMVELGVERRVMAERLRISIQELARSGARLGVRVPRSPGAHWTLAMADSSKTLERRRESMRASRARAAARRVAA